jgi:hypothetical protein
LRRTPTRPRCTTASLRSNRHVRNKFGASGPARTPRTFRTLESSAAPLTSGTECPTRGSARAFCQDVFLCRVRNGSPPRPTWRARHDTAIHRTLPVEVRSTSTGQAPSRKARATRAEPAPRSGARAESGGGGNRTPVRGRTEQSVYKLRLLFDLTRRPECSRPAVEPAILKSRAAGDWHSIGASPLVVAAIRTTGPVRSDASPN